MQYARYRQRKMVLLHAVVSHESSHVVNVETCMMSASKEKKVSCV